MDREDAEANAGLRYPGLGDMPANLDDASNEEVEALGEEV